MCRRSYNRAAQGHITAPHISLRIRSSDGREVRWDRTIQMAYLAQKPTMCIFYMSSATLALRNCPRSMSFLADQKGQGLLLALESICILEALKLFTHLPKQPNERQDILLDKDKPISNQEYVFDLYNSWEKRCLKHISKLSPKALDIFQRWNIEIAKYQGLINWQTLKLPD